jgi:hypothetical protein
LLVGYFVEANQMINIVIINYRNNKITRLPNKKEKNRRVYGQQAIKEFHLTAEQTNKCSAKASCDESLIE